jgi:DMSO/TMAO reductase YedYZ molybdopterin-dependent catalytic subunit
MQVRRRSVEAALTGLAAVAAALGVAELVALLTGPLTSPLLAVGGVVIDLVPEPVKEFGIALFGTNDKLALQVGTLVLLGAAAIGIGLLATRRGLRSALIGVAAFAVLGAVAALTRYHAGPTAVLPSAVGGLAGAAVLTLLVRRLTAAGASAETATSLSRRHVLVLAGAIAGWGAATAIFGRWYGARRDVTRERTAIQLPTPASPAPPLPPEVDAGLPELAPFVTPNENFYLIDTTLIAPQVAPEDWRLRIHGRVRRPMTLSYADLMRRPMIERYLTLCCVSNDVGGGLVGNARWLGARVADLLAEADPEPGADQVVSRSVDGFTAGTPTEVLRDGRDALLAIGMNGEPLPIRHGFPVRMVVPGLYGYVSATKWLAELELTTFADFDAYWIPRGWSQKAPVKLMSRIDTPRSRSKVRPGSTVIAGVAWATHVGISAVEVKVDGGPWLPASLAAAPSVDTWRQWSMRWEATPGTHRLTVRTYDANGTRQVEEEQPPAPDGATGWHTVTINVG